MSIWKQYNPSPQGRMVGDCAVRAVAKAIGADWDKAYAELALMGFTLGDMPNANWIINAVLKQYGFERKVIPDTCPDCYTVAMFADEHPKGTYILGTGDHVVTVENGVIWDSWDSSLAVPVFYWEIREEEEEEEEKKDGV